MKRLLLAAAVAASTTPVLAADVIYEEPAAPAPVVAYEPAFVWTGFYAGATVGYVFDNATEITGFNDAGTFSSRYLTDDDGVTASAFAGYNYEWNGVVLGAEADIEYLDSQDSRSTFRGGAVTGADQSWQGSIRARLGYGIDRALIYATAGLALGDIDYTATDFSGTATSSSTETGYTVGAGIDFAATDTIFVRGEYRFTDYGTRTISTAANSYEFDTQSHIVKAGVGFRF
ncbi:outer membrane protein [Aureimonas populi]|uniref:Outer membrane protein n=1 Tax=Aureimonas populi TaxID=1701758 RepID=A0ABW5CL71_9HYPH|nr:outer membrane protein [Aureimonas populi]